MGFELSGRLGTGEVVGLSPGEIFYVVGGIKDGDPRSWRRGFRREGRYLQRLLAAGRRRHEFKDLDGAHAHCQVNDTFHTHAFVFDWPDRSFG